MASKIKNIIIFTVIAVVLILIYIFFVKPSPEEPNLVSNSFSEDRAVVPDGAILDTLEQNSEIAKDFLALLLSVKNIKLNDDIFSKKSFINLRDSTILLIPTGDEGRPNPFAPIGYESVIAPKSPPISSPSSTSSSDAPTPPPTHKSTTSPPSDAPTIPPPSDAPTIPPPSDAPTIPPPSDE